MENVGELKQEVIELLAKIQGELDQDYVTWRKVEVWGLRVEVLSHIGGRLAGQLQEVGVKE